MAEEQPNLEATMGLIINGGNAKSFAFEAIHAAKEGKFDEAHQKLEDADEALSKAHNSQTEMLTAEAQGKKQPVTLLTVHSQDHLMNAITFRDLAGEMIDLYKRLAKVEEKESK